MNLDETLRKSLIVEAALMAGILTTLYLLTPTQSSYFQLYELVGALFAGILTTFGLYKMRQLT